MAKEKTKCIVVLSGGQDSTTCLVQAMADDSKDVLATIFFNYGQRHLVERKLAKWWADYYKLPMEVLDLVGLRSLGNSALLNDMELGTEHKSLQGFPSTYVPGRNLLFLTYASALAMKLGATEVITGVCQTDYSGYPDCRQESISALEGALKLGMAFPELTIHTPLMYLTKGETFMLADDLGELDNIIRNTHTGYTGKREKLYAWGWADANEKDFDGATRLRIKGYHDYLKLKEAKKDSSKSVRRSRKVKKDKKDV